MKKISLYIHVPFCKQKCFYCDFPSYAGKEDLMDDYVDALIKEMHEKCKGYIIKTIFIGGGTPSYLSVDLIEKLLSEIKKLNLDTNIEFTVECNPGVLFEEKLKVMKLGGVNRISFGLQSCNDNLLKKIGRIHTFDEFEENFNTARRIGFNNINVDLMYGLPNLTVDIWRDTLEKICELKPEHISAYSLIIEEGTAFYKMYEKNLLNLPSEDEEREMDKLTKDFLKSKGYNQYEVSNYALKGKECEHNKVYWKTEEYIGIGSSSSSYIDNFRVSNITSVKGYINNINTNKTVEEERYKNTREDNIEEFIFMGLRMIKGINLQEFNRRFGVDITSIYECQIEKNIRRGLLIIKDGNLKLTEKGINLSNNVMSDFILDK